MTEKTVLIEDADPVVVLGFDDRNLSQLEQAFPNTTLTARGSKIKLKGPGGEVETLSDILDDMISMVRRGGEITKSDVSTLLALANKVEGKSRPEKTPFKQDTGDIILHTHTGESVAAKTEGQLNIIRQSENNDILFAIGPAGTGKTYTSVALAVRALKQRKVKRIILARPAVEAGENLGFLPGDLKEKIDPYLRPLYDALEEMIEFDKLEFQLQKNIIEIAPLAYMRGRTLNNAFVILDEAQNATNTQMKMFLTRIGFNSRAIITGDITQTDLPRKQESGLITIQKILKNIDGIAFAYLNQDDVVRHKLVRDIIDAYDKYESKKR
ncbi:PhoH family protein [Rhodohalobacter sp. SW132]|uniref:PhoH family protein n=1 Tax=Rhodohalobacter sp. SW132 TaxID=2293433 RepID=UPI000E24B391|nr:PhoH family protein [Rhodohalobacter sp. SW132]